MIYVSGHFRSFEGYFEDENSNLLRTIDLASRKSYKNTYDMHTSDLVKELSFQVFLRHLRSFGGHFEVTCLLQTQF